MDLVRMTTKIQPNLMSYSTLMDGYSKGKHIDEMHMLNVYDEMKHLFIRLDKMYNNTLVRVYVLFDLVT